MAYCTALCSRVVLILEHHTPNVSLHCGFNSGAVAFHDQMCYQRGVSPTDQKSERESGRRNLTDQIWAQIWARKFDESDLETNPGDRPVMHFALNIRMVFNKGFNKMCSVGQNATKF